MSTPQYTQEIGSRYCQESKELINKYLPIAAGVVFIGLASLLSNCAFNYISKSIEISRGTLPNSIPPIPNPTTVPRSLDTLILHAKKN
jgi:hypothetical protein